MKKIFFSFLGVLFLLACSKDKFKTEPQVEIESLSPNEVFNDGIFTLRATVRDKEGDLQDTVYLVSKRFDENDLLLTNDTIPFSMVNFGFPDKTQIELEVKFSYGEDRPGYIFQNLETSDRNFALGIIVKDKAGNKSEYVESDKIVLKKF
jgi:hypothetical protein